jgi:protein-L-isoaspartate(D-aspartate) O-methyltransferase
VDDSDPRWLSLIYSDEALFIAMEADRLSSSSAPGIMARFLELLRVEDDSTVLEIGTGSGYNAALLCERLGSANVTTIDIDNELAEAAKARFIACGYRPTVACASGWDGYPEKAPYDRIIATCSVSRIPEPWIDQLRPSGILVTPLRGGRFDSIGLVSLRMAEGGSMYGRLHPRGASFMRMRGGEDEASGLSRKDLRALVATMDGDSRPCTVPRYMVDEGEPSGPPHFLLRLHDTSPWEWFWPPGPEGEPPSPAVAAPDGSWARVVTVQTQPEPAYIVYQGGPRRLWDEIERSWQTFLRLGKPDMGRYGIIVTRDREQFIWLDDPTGQYRWVL